MNFDTLCVISENYITGLSRLHSENGYSEETLSDDIPSLLTSTLSEECINCCVLSFLAEHDKTKHSY